MTENTSSTPSIESMLPQVFGAGTNLRGLVANRYRLEGKLGAGEGGVVYAARDLLMDQQVAIKVSSKGDGSLAREFMTTRMFRHPHIVRVLSAGPCGEALEFLTMELLTGVPLSDATDFRDDASIATIALGAARALKYVHDRGYIHGDLKPDNIWLALADGLVTAKILDFGLATRGAGDVRGTPAYLAPELLQGGAPDARTDLYSLGVSLFEAATGRNPFRAPSTAEVFQRIQGLDITTVGICGPAVQGIILRLIARSPDLRFPDATALIEALLELPELAGAERADTAPELAVAPLVQRADVMDPITALISSGAPEGGLVVVGGSHGMGKTRILDEAAVLAELQGVPVVRMGARAGGASRIEALLHSLSLLLPDAYDMAVRARSSELPAWVARPGWPEGAREDMPSPFSLVDLIAAVVASARIVTTWDDADTLGRDDGLVLRLLLPHLTGPGRVLVISHTSADSSLGSALAAVTAQTVPASLAPLDVEGSGDLIEGLLCRPSPESGVVPLLHEASRGNPGLIVEIVTRQLGLGGLRLNEGRLIASSALLQSAPDQLLPNWGEGGLAELGLGDADVATLRVAALLGEPFEADALEGVVQDAGVVAALDRARQRGIVTEVSGHGWRFADVRVRAALRSGAHDALPPRQLRRTAEFLLQTAPDSVLDAADLLAHIGARGEALAVVTQAAERSTRVGRPGEAMERYRWAIERTLDVGLAARLHEAAGDGAVALGDFQGARDHFEAALSLQGGPRSSLTRKIGWAHTLAGDCRSAIPVLGEALAVALEEDSTAEALQDAHFALGWSLMLVGQYGEGEDHALRGFAVTSAPSPALARLHRLVGTILWTRGQGPQAIVAFERGIEVARSVDDVETLADCLMGLGTAQKVIRQLDQSAATYDAAIAQNRRLGRIVQVAKCLNGRGVVRYLMGRWDEAIAAWEQYRDVCIPVGDQIELGLAFNNLGFLYKDRGELERSRRALVKGLDIMRRAGFARGEAMVLGNLGEALGLIGEHDEAVALVTACRALAVTLGAADEVLEADRRLAEIALLRGDLDAAIEQGRAVCAQAEKEGNGGEVAAAQLILGLAAQEQGDGAAAEELLASAEAGFEKSGGSIGVLRARLALVRARGERDPRGALAVCRTARQEAASLGAGTLLKEADRLIRQLEPVATRPMDGRALKALRQAATFGRILDVQRLLDEVTDSAVELCEAERGMLILFSKDGEPVVHTTRLRDTAPEDTPDLVGFRLSRSVADRVYREKVSVAITDVSTDEAFSAQQSIREMQLRSILCVPLLSGDECLGILYVDSAKERANLGTETLTVLEAMAAMAATAVVNARFFEEEETKVRLMSTMVHELRSPLTGFRGLIDLMLQTSPEAEREFGDLLRAVRSQMDRLERLTAESEQLYRLLGKKDALARGPFSLAQVVDGAIAATWQTARQSSLTVECDIEEGLAAALGDPDWVAQIVTNLLSNAIKYTPPGGRIEVSVARNVRAKRLQEKNAVGWSPKRSGARPEIIVRVRDTGPGVAAGEEDAIFEWGIRGSAGRTSGKAGQGLGLGLVRQLVAIHKGTHGVTPNVWGGACFWFTLPTAEDNDSGETRHADVSVGRPIAIHRPRRAKVGGPAA